MDVRLDLCFLVCSVIHATLGQNFDAILRGLSGFSGGNDLYQGFGSSSAAFASSSASGPCPYSPHPDRLKFIQRVNDQTFVQACAPGTMYDDKTCGCVNIPKGQGQAHAGGNPRFGSAARSLSGAGSGMARINDIVNQLQSRAMRPPTPARPTTGRRTATPVRSPSPAPTRAKPVKPQSRSSSSTNHMDLLRQMAQSNPAGGVPLDIAKTSPIGPSTSTLYAPKTLFAAPGGVHTGTVTADAQATARQIGKSVVKLRTLPTNSTPLYKLVPRLTNPDTDPLAGLLMELSKQQELSKQHDPPQQTNTPPLGQAHDTTFSGFDAISSMYGRGSGGGTNIASLLGAMGGGSLGGAGGGADLSALLASLGGGTSSLPGGSAHSLLNPQSFNGNLRTATLFRDTAGTPDMTSMFNLQGRAAGAGGLGSFSNINVARLQELDSQGFIDLSDLSVEGAAAASRHFSG